VYDFQYAKANDVGQAVTSVSPTGAKFVAGGTTLIDLMKLDVERPNQAARGYKRTATRPH
jgi:xanthine dehydrogenase YagS FAD-binding subunit